MSRRNLYWLLGIAAVALFGFTVSYSAPTREKDKDYELVRLVVDVLHEVETKYVVELNPQQKQKLIEDMLNGGLERLDPHSMYINAKEYRNFKKQNTGKFGGIGIEIGYDRQNRGQITVRSPWPGTPAYRAGVLAGDAIVKIDGKSTENMRVTEAADLIQGAPRQPVVLTVYHEGKTEPVDIEIVREMIKIDTVMGDRRDAGNREKWNFFLGDAGEGIGYIRLTVFSEKSAQEMVAALKDLKEKNLRGLIIDLRNNPGGLLREAVNISNLFLKEGERIVSTKGRTIRDQVYDARSEDELLHAIYHREDREKELVAAGRGVMLQPAERFPIVVLINKNSASASEILAAALQDDGRAAIAGERSYGKGSVQDLIEMHQDNEESALKLTTASYWRPSGKNIHRLSDSKDTDEWGVKPTPGLEVPMKEDERYEYMTYRSDRDIVRDQAKPEKPNDKKKKDFKDRVLEKALEHLRKQIKEGKAALMLPVRGRA